MKKEQSNCIGYVFYALGVRKVDTAIQPPVYKNLAKYFIVAKQNDEDVIGAITKDRGVLACHLAVVDNIDRRYVLHRPGTGGKIRRETKEKAFESYVDVGCLLVNLKLRKQFRRIY